MILDLDIGNTRIKWRLSEDRVIAEPHLVSSGTVSELAELIAATVARYPVARVRAASVRGGELLAELTALLANDWQLTVQTAQVVRECQGVTVAYEKLARLGVDRWLAMLAAYRDAQGSCVVVDCGTAMTIDLIDTEGLHLGGYIVPGLRLVPDSLTRNTAIVLEQEPGWGLKPGISTEQAIYHGTMQMLVALLETTLAREFPARPGVKAPVVYLTGGDAVVLARFLDCTDVTLKQVQDLVFRGLALAVP